LRRFKMKSGICWRQAGLAWLVLLLLNPLHLAGDEVKSENVRGSYILRNVKVEPVLLMAASSESYRVFWTMDEVAREEEEGGLTTGLTGEPAMPLTFSLSQNYPNPFNPSTTITFSVPEEGTGVTSLQIYDIRGRLLRTLVDEELGSGNYSVHWDGVSDRGELVSSGIYLYRLRQGAEVQTRKMTVVR
jgi:hypothetical protein